MMLVVFVFIFALCMTACADVYEVNPCLDGEPYNFWNGLWHGLIAPFSFIISLFKDDVAIYGINNNGNWYNLGFVLGAAIIFGSGGNASGRKGG